MSDDLVAAAEVIDGAGSIALACHVHPDGDALGSLLAMQHLCDANGKAAVASWGSPFIVGPHYEFLPGLDRTVPPDAFPADPEVLVTFDLGNPERLGDLADRVGRAGTVVVLDHHGDNEHFGDVNVVDLDAAATTVLVRRLAELMGWRLSRDAALCLYVGLVTDTGRFQYPNTDQGVFRLAEELAGFDLPIADITRELFEKHRFRYVQLVAMVLARAEFDPEDRFIAGWVTGADLDRYDVEFDETESLIDHLRQTAEADVSCVAKEAPGEGLRVSLRSTGPVDVGAVAARLGGGGHSFMAGFVSEWSIPDTISRVRAEIAG